ncbi:MAG: TetR/AcrR family transcriptional regulator [Treponema sp.]|nr:TetR/AcrR family transcriptional regulator [Treponema sp.]
MADEKVNSSALLSKEFIIESFLDMLAVKPISSISISEIAENAKIDRRTFYRHFKTKNDVIKYYINKVSKQFEEKMLNYNVKDIYSNTKSIFEVLFIMKETLLILHKQGLLDLFLSEFKIIYEKYYYKYVSPELLKLDNIDYFMAHEIGGEAEVVKMWITKGCTYSPDKMGKMFKDYISLIKETF